VVAVLLVVTVARAGGSASDVRLLLVAGVVVGAFANAAVMVALADAPPDRVRGALWWMMGSVAGASWAQVGWLTGYAVAALVALTAWARDIDALALGDEPAAALGVDVPRAVWRVFLAASLLAAASVAAAGLVGFVGPRGAAPRARGRRPGAPRARPRVRPRRRRAGGRRRPRRPHAARAGRASARRGHGPRRRAVLPPSAAGRAVNDRDRRVTAGVVPVALRFDAVALQYRRAAGPALDGVSFDAPPGRVTAVAGPNGSGKSSSVRALLARTPLSAGRVLVTAAGAEPRDVRAVPAAERARLVAVVPQREEPAFPLRVREYVALGRLPHGTRWGGAAAGDGAAVAAALDAAGVAAFAGRMTDELSGGEWQRVRLARALAQQAGALVLDEPTTFLDVAHEMAVFELAAREAALGRAVLLVSHQLNLVARFADHLVLLHRGRVAAAGPPAVVMDGATLERVYDWPLVVTRDPAVGAPALVPLRSGGRR
jgi:iron complex transport system ATP-binding protein